MRGTIRARTEKGGKTVYMATFGWTDPKDGKRKQRSAGTFTKKGDAQRALREALSRVDKGTWADPSKMTVREWLEDEWLPSLEVRDRTRQSYTDIVKGWLIPGLGGVALSQLTPELVRSFLASLKGAERLDGRDDIRASTTAYVGTILRIALHEATRRGLLQRNPATHIRRPKVEAKEMRTWTAQEAQAFEVSVPGNHRLHALWLLALALGLRTRRAARPAVERRGPRRRPTQRPPAAPRRKRRAAHLRPAQDQAVDAPACLFDPRLVTALRAHHRRQLEERMAWGSA